MPTSAPYCLIITGPTASGKTDLSLAIAREVETEIINGDMGQFYEPIAIGTSKPDWQRQSIPHHFFDLLKEPTDCTVRQYRQLVVEKVNEIAARGKLPIIVGGSLFYIKSLFFPPVELPDIDTGVIIDDGHLWERLSEIDPDRAAQVHPNDAYRLKRALAIWQTTGKRPSELLPAYDPPFNAHVVFLDPPTDWLFERINQRTEIMMRDGWIEECARLLGTPWEDFLRRKGLIGYSEIIQWLRKGKNHESMPVVIQSIQKQTRDYAKRQRTFWQSLSRSLTKWQNTSTLQCAPVTITDIAQAANQCITYINEGN